MSAHADAASRPPGTAVRAVWPAALAALGEAGIVFLPGKVLMEQASGADGGPLVWYPAFLLLFAAGTALATRFRTSRAMPTAAAAVAGVVAAVQGFGWGTLGAAELGVAATVCLVVASRVVTLSLRDWRNPMHGSFGWGAGILLIEVILGGSIGTTWRRDLPVIVALFFLASLASRAASVRLTDVPGARAEGEGPDAGRRLPLIVLALMGAPILAMGILVGVGGLELLGRLVQPALVFLVSSVAFIASQLARPIFWLAELVNLDLDALREFLDRLRTGNDVLPEEPAAGGNPIIRRLLGLVPLLLMGFLLLLLVRFVRRRRWGDEGEWADGEEPPAPRPEPLGPPVRVRRRAVLRRELPEETVRRWYAEALMVLERKGVPRPAGATPDEYLRTVGAAFPECRHGFHALTRAYERVRYGHRTLPSRDVRELEPRRGHVMEVLRRAKPLQPAEQEAEA
ncbi:MAG TPA: DUF4129 domain-containing protein [Actinomycetota bacterium]|nr:DUF4129 domain-containing protein [Actinomycetota bacterium]